VTFEEYTRHIDWSLTVDRRRTRQTARQGSINCRASPSWYDGRPLRWRNRVKTDLQALERGQFSADVDRCGAYKGNSRPGGSGVLT
jgi:hypothetical protein